MILFGFFSFILLNYGTSTISMVLLFLLIFGACMYISESIYVHKIRKYPKTFLVVTHSDVHFFAIMDNQIQIHQALNLNVNKLNEVFFGNFDEKRNQIGCFFEIRKNDNILLSGKLNLVNNNWIVDDFPQKFLFPTQKLQQIINS